MKENETIVIEKIGNGWMIRPYTTGPELIATADLFSFQRMEYDHDGVQNSEKCLFGFLLKHFPAV